MLRAGFHALPMTARTRFLITAALVCHLLVAPGLVTSQLHSSTGSSGEAQNLPAAPSQLNEEEVTIRALEQEKQGTLYKLRGKAEIHYGTYILYADSVDYNSDTGEAIADGHVLLEGGPNDEHIEATHATYNIHTESGRFETVRGTTGMQLRNARLTLTSSNPFAFSGRVVEKPGPDHYVVYDGTITTCELPHPKWEFSARQVNVEVGGKATIYRSTFFIRGVPVFYFPFATHPVQHRPRQSGFLIPNVGRSSIKGTILGEGVFLAIRRDMDATIGAEYFSTRGWAPQGRFRFEPSERSFAYVNVFSVLDHSSLDQGGTEVQVIAEDDFNNHFRGVANIDYLSSFIFRVIFNDVFTQAINSEVKSEAFLSATKQGYFYNGSTQRYQNFESTNPGDVITILHAPSFNSSSVDRQIGHSSFHWAYDAAAEGLSRKECVEQTSTGCKETLSTAALVGRLDLSPSVSAPLFFHGWSFRPEVSLRDTLYSQRLLTTNGVEATEDKSVNRKALEGTFEVRPPVVERIFDREFLGRKWKHVVEPRVTYRYVTGINNFADILRFDQRDILSNTNEVEYGVVNRLYAKRTSDAPEDCGPPGMPALITGRPGPPTRVPWEHPGQPRDTPCQAAPRTREIITWELAQKYFLDPTFGGALVPGQRNVFTTTADFTGIAFLTGTCPASPPPPAPPTPCTDSNSNTSRRLSPLISRLRIQPTTRAEAEWDIDYDFKKGRINASTVFVNYRIGLFTIGGGDAFLQSPNTSSSSGTTTSPQTFNQYRLLFGYGHSNKQGLSAATNLGFDANLNSLQYAAVQTTYNWDCCGVILEYRRFALGSSTATFTRNENQFRFTFALANVGAFGNLRRQEKLF
jgi:LPS-assembly protein